MKTNEDLGNFFTWLGPWCSDFLYAHPKFHCRIVQKQIVQGQLMSNQNIWLMFICYVQNVARIITTQWFAGDVSHLNC
jgi:hypothetical protein